MSDDPQTSDLARKILRQTEAEGLPGDGSQTGLGCALLLAASLLFWGAVAFLAGWTS